MYRRAIETSAGQARRPHAPPLGPAPAPAAAPARRRAPRPRRAARCSSCWRAASCGGCGCGGAAAAGPQRPGTAAGAAGLTGDGVKVGTFLGNYGRRYYGLGPAPKRLDVLWKVDLGSGWSSGKYDKDAPEQVGRERLDRPAERRRRRRQDVHARQLLRVQPAPDRRATGKVVWAYKFDDIIKSSPSVFRNPRRRAQDDKYIVVAGSRRGYRSRIDDPTVAPSARRHVRQRQGAVAPAGAADRRATAATATAAASSTTACSTSGVESGWFYALDPLKTQPWTRWKKPLDRASATAARRRAQRQPRRRPRARGVGRGARREPVHRLRRRPRVRSAALRPQGRVGLLRRLGPRRHARAQPQGPAAAGRSRSSTSRARAACSLLDPTKPPDRPPCGSSRPATARSATGAAASWGRRPSTTSTTRTAASGAVRVQRHRRLPVRGVAGHA